MSQTHIFGLKKLRVRPHWLGSKNRIKRHLLDILNQMNLLSNIRKSKQSLMMRKEYQAPTTRTVRCIIFGEMRRMSGAFGGKLHLNPI